MLLGYLFFNLDAIWLQLNSQSKGHLLDIDSDCLNFVISFNLLLNTVPHMRTLGGILSLQLLLVWYEVLGFNIKHTLY